MVLHIKKPHAAGVGLAGVALRAVHAAEVGRAGAVVARLVRLARPVVLARAVRAQVHHYNQRNIIIHTSKASKQRCRPSMVSQ